MTGCGAPELQTCGLVLFVLWPAVVSTHLVLTVHQPQPAVLLSWLKCWVVLGLAFTLETLLARKVGEGMIQLGKFY